MTSRTSRGRQQGRCNTDLHAGVILQLCELGTDAGKQNYNLYTLPRIFF